MKIFYQVIRALRSNIVRTLLTTLGVVIGIAMVILVLSAGQGFRSFIISQIELYGTNTIFIETRIPPTTKALSSGKNQNINTSTGTQAVAIITLKERDLDDIKKIPNVDDAYGIVIGQKVTAYKDVKKNVFLWGSDPARFNVDPGKLTGGRFYTEAEELSAAQVAILGYNVAKDLFKDEDPVGKTIRVDRYNFLVIGTYEQRGGIGPNSTDMYLYVPLRTAQKKLLGIDYLLMAIAKVGDQNIAPATAEDIKAVLRQNHNIDDPAKDDFLVTTAAQGLDTLSVVLSAISLLLIAVAGISLTVGGVGIMNIMYVVVTERTAEIGLKKALGAKNSDIQQEFLLEAIIITLIGGILGIILGAALAYLVSIIANSFNFDWKFTVPLSSIIIAVGASSAIGIVFGVMPARRAAKLDPIEALRYEQ